MPRLPYAAIALAACAAAKHRDPGANPDAPPISTTTDASADAPPDAPGSSATCPSPVAADPHLADRLACRFTAGARAADTVGLDDATRAALPIKHVIVIMKENRSFDHIFGGLGAMQPDAETFPAS